MHLESRTPTALASTYLHYLALQNAFATAVHKQRESQETEQLLNSFSNGTVPPLERNSRNESTCISNVQIGPAPRGLPPSLFPGICPVPSLPCLMSAIFPSDPSWLRAMSLANEPTPLPFPRFALPNGQSLSALPPLVNFPFGPFGQFGLGGLGLSMGMGMNVLRRAVFTEEQRRRLEVYFQKHKYINKHERARLAAQLGLRDSQVLNHLSSFFLNIYDSKMFRPGTEPSKRS